MEILAAEQTPDNHNWYQGTADAVLLNILEREAGHDFGRELIPGALNTYQVRPFLFRDFWVDVGTIESFYEANVMLGRTLAPFRFWDLTRPIYTRLRHLPGSRLTDCRVRNAIFRTGLFLNAA